MLKTCFQKLDDLKVRLTKNREAILNVLHRAKGPLAPFEIVEGCHALGRRAHKTTIYRELERMEQAGIVQKVMVSDRKQYFELTERGHHHHLICAQCNAIEDIIFSEEDRLLKQSQQIARQKGFSIIRHSVEFFGVCKQCS